MEQEKQKAKKLPPAENLMEEYGVSTKKETTPKPAPAINEVKVTSASEKATPPAEKKPSSSSASTDSTAPKKQKPAEPKKAKEATNPLVAIANDYIAKGKESVTWNFATIPSDSWKNGLGSALTRYAAGNGSWNDVKTAFVNGWKKEYDAAHK